MGRMVTKTYIGAYIQTTKNFNYYRCSEEFRSAFLDTGKFISPYQGLEDLSVLIPSGNDYAIYTAGCGDNWDEEVVVSDFSSGDMLKEKLLSEYDNIIEQLEGMFLDSMFPKHIFEVKFGVIVYRDEVG